MINLKTVTKTYGEFAALDQVNLTIRQGEIYGFLGHNGAGKTTAMKIISGLTRPDSGSVVFDQKGLKLGYMPETPAFYQTLTLLEYLGFIAGLCETPIDKRRLYDLIDRVGLGSFANRRVSRFSRGMRQRAALAVALIDDPDILLLDEPLSALDPEGRKDLSNIIGELKREGKTIMISTHILTDVEGVCDRVGILKQGQMMLERSLESLKNDFVFPIVDICLAEVSQGLDPSEFTYVEKVVSEGSCHSVYLKDVRLGKQELLKHYADTGEEILSLSQRSSTLEEIYMQIIREGERT